MLLQKSLAEGTVNVCLLHLLESLMKMSKQIAFTSKSVPFGSMLSLVSMTGVVEVLSHGDSTVIFASCCSDCEKCRRM